MMQFGQRDKLFESYHYEGLFSIIKAFVRPWKEDKHTLLFLKDSVTGLRTEKS